MSVRRLRKFVVRMQFEELRTQFGQDVIAERWVLATSPKDAHRVVERIYPSLTITAVSNSMVANPSERYLWHFRRWTRPDWKAGAQ